MHHGGVFSIKRLLISTILDVTGAVYYTMFEQLGLDSFGTTSCLGVTRTAGHSGSHHLKASVAPAGRLTAWDGAGRTDIVKCVIAFVYCLIDHVR